MPRNFGSISGKNAPRCSCLVNWPGVEISDRTRVDLAGIDLRIVDRFLAGFRDQVADRFAFLLEVALKIGSAAAEDVDWVHNCWA